MPLPRQTYVYRVAPPFFSFLVLLSGWFLAPGLITPASAQWSSDPAENLTLANSPEGQAQPKIVATSDGGFYVSWLGGLGNGFDVYLQRLDAEGNPLWDDGGILIADRDFSSTQNYGLSIDADGYAYLAFRLPDSTGTNQAMAVRVAPDGELLWGDPGTFASSGDEASAPGITAIQDGGAVVAWTSSDGDIVLQKLDGNGNPLWGPDGIAITLPSGFFFLADLHADDNGNVIVSGSAQLTFSDRRLWAQRLNTNGEPLWGAEPIEVFDGSDGALQLGYFPPFSPDGSGGAVFAWYQVGSTGSIQARVQHVLSNGTMAFPQNGVDVATGTGIGRSRPSATFDAATGDIYVLWAEDRDPTDLLFAVVAQRIDPTGTRTWGDSGITIGPVNDEQASQVIALPAPDGAFFAWSRGSSSSPNPMRIEAARLNAAGEFVWPSEIVALKTGPTHHNRTQGTLSTQGFAAYVWADGDNFQIVKAQNLNPDGTLGPGTITNEDGPARFELTGPAPNPALNTTSLTLRPGKTQRVRVQLSDTLGRFVQTAYDGVVTADSEETIPLKLGNLAAGVYALHVEGETFSRSRLLTVVR